MLPFDPLDFDRHRAVVLRTLFVDEDEAAATKYVEAVAKHVEKHNADNQPAKDEAAKLRAFLDVGKEVAALDDDKRQLILKWANDL